MSVYLTSTEITLEALRILKNNLVAAKQVNRSYDSSFGISGAKIGATLNVRKPIRYIGGEGAAITPEDTVETYVPVTLNRQAHVALSFTTADLLLSIDEFSKRFIAPAVANIANKIDLAVMELYKQVPSFVGVPGTTPDDLDDALNAGAMLDNQSAPMDEQRSLIVNPTAQAKIVYALKGLFQSSEQIKQQYEKGKMGIAAGFNWYTDQNVWSHTVGSPAGAGAAVVTSISEDGKTVSTSTWTANSALKKGDVISIEGVYAVNCQSRQALNYEAQFVVTADCADNADGVIDIPISPAIVSDPTSPFQNVSVAPAAGKLIRLFGKVAASFSDVSGKVSPQNLAFHRDAFTLVTADLPEVRGVDMFARIADEDTGISIRLVRQYQGLTDALVTRLDVLFGVACLRPELAVRIVG